MDAFSPHVASMTFAGVMRQLKSTRLGDLAAEHWTGSGTPRSARESRSRRDRTIADGGITDNVTAPETGGPSATTRSAHRIGNVERLDALDCTAWSQCVKRSTSLPRIEPATLGGDLSRDHHAGSALPNLRVRRAGPGIEDAR